MSQTVVAKVVAKRSLRHLAVGVDRAHDTKIGVGVDRCPVSVTYHGDPMSSQCAGKRQFAHPFGQRHHSGNGHGRITADKDVDSKRFARLDRSPMVHADSAMDLVVHADLSVRFVLVARKLNAVHAHV